VTRPRIQRIVDDLIERVEPTGAMGVIADLRKANSRVLRTLPVTF
jgi:hypothetical protein